MVSKPVLDLLTCLKLRCIWSISGLIQHSLVLFPQFWWCAFSRWPEVYSGFNQYFKTAPCRGWNGEQNSGWRYRFQAFEYQMGTMESGDNPSGFLIYKWPLFSYIITWSIVEAHKQQQLQLQLIASGKWKKWTSTSHFIRRSNSVDASCCLEVALFVLELQMDSSVYTMLTNPLSSQMVKYRCHVAPF